MTGVELAAAGYLFHWAKQRGRGAGEQAGKEADAVLGAALARLREIVVTKIGGGDRRLERLEREAAALEAPSDKARDDLAGDLRTEGEEDPDFAARLAAAVQALRELAPESAGTARAGDHGIAANSMVFNAASGSIAAARIEGGAVIHPPQPDPHRG